MDLSKRQLLQEALAKAEAHHAFIAISTPSGSRILLRPDFTCYETYVEGTDPDGQLLRSLTSRSRRWTWNRYIDLRYASL